MRGERTQRLNRSAFTVAELMVAVSLMSLIVLALYSMFNQVQRAMLANEAQVDTTERGRSLLELVSRELESARVGNRGEVTNLWLTAPVGATIQQGDTSIIGPARTNIFNEVFYMTKANKAWRGVGYVVGVATNVNKDEFVSGLASGQGVGSLYRYETLPKEMRGFSEWEYGFPSTNLFLGFWNVSQSIRPPSRYPIGRTNSELNHIADGIVHFRVTPFDTRGRVMTATLPSDLPADVEQWLDPTYRIVRTDAGGGVVTKWSTTMLGTNENFANVVLQQHPANSLETMAAFKNGALPAYLELELGVLEPATLKQYRQLREDGLTNRAEAFVANRIAKVQIFRKRIPLRTVSQ